MFFYAPGGDCGAQAVERSLKARLAAQCGVALVLLERAQGQPLGFGNLLRAGDRNLHSGKEGIIAIVERVGKAGVDEAVERVECRSGVALIEREHEAQHFAVRTVQPEQCVHGGCRRRSGA